MAGVTRFETPMIAESPQTYVSQYVPLPFEEMKQSLDRTQRKYNANKDVAGKMVDELSANFLDVDQRPVVEGKVHQYVGAVNTALDSYNGDWGKMDRTLLDIKQDINKTKNSAEWVNATASKTMYDESIKNTAKSDMPGFDKDVTNYYNKKKYKDEGGVVGKQSPIDIANPYSVKDYSKAILDRIGKVEFNTKSTPVFDITNDGKLLVSGYDDVSTRDKTQITSAVKGAILNAPEFKDMVNKKWQMYSYLRDTEDPMYGKVLGEGMTYDDFVKQEYMSIAGDYSEMTAEQEQKRRNYKFTPTGSGWHKQELSLVPITTTRKQHFDYKEYDNVIKNGVDKTVNGIANKSNERLNEIHGSLKTIFTQEGIVKTDNEYKANLQDLEAQVNQQLLDSGFDKIDVNTHQGQKVMLEKIASGDVSVSGLAGHLSVPRIRQEASNILRKTRNDNKIILETLEDAASQGLAGLTPETYKKYIAWEKKTGREMGILQDKIAKGQASAEEKQEYKTYTEYSGITGGLAIGAGSFLQNLMFGDTPAEELAKELRSNEDTYFLGDIVEALESKDINQIVYNKLDNAKNEAVAVPAMNNWYIKDAEGNIDTATTQKFTKDVKAYVTDNLDDILKKNIHIPGQEATQTLDEYFRNDYSLRTKGRFDADDFEKEYDKYKKTLPATLNFATATNPVSGNMMIFLGGKAVDIGEDEGMINFPTIEEYIAPEQLAGMRVNSLKLDVQKQPRREEELTDGFILTVAQPGASESLKKLDEKYKQQEKDGSLLNIKIRNSDFGIFDPNREYTMLPKESYDDILKIYTSAKAKFEDRHGGGLWIGEEQQTLDSYMRYKISEYLK